MAIKSIRLNTTGLVGTNPQIIYIETDDTLEEVTRPGYLDSAAAQGAQFDEKMLACVSTKKSPNDESTQVVLLDVERKEGAWSLDYPDNVPQFQSFRIEWEVYQQVFNQPQLLLPPPGEGRYYVVTRAVWIIIPAGTPFAAGGDSGIQYGDTPQLGGQLAATTIPASTVNTSTGLMASADGDISAAPLESVINQPLYLSNNTAPFVDGSGNVIAKLWFYVAVA